MNFQFSRKLIFKWKKMYFIFFLLIFTFRISFYQQFIHIYRELINSICIIKIFKFNLKIENKFTQFRYF